MANDQQRAQLLLEGIARGQYPRYLYKYREFNNYTESIFRDHSLWFSKPMDFNDPFDCRIVDAGNYSVQDLVNYLVGLGVPGPQASALALQAAQDPTRIAKFVEDKKNEVFNRHGILALSELPDSILMWSYYCGGHKGFVLGFDVQADPLFFVTALHARYVKTYPSFQYLHDKSKIVSHGMVSKLDLWDHEHEIRVIKDTVGLHSFDPRCLTEVIFGCKTDDADRNRLINYITTYGYTHVHLKRAVPSDTAFQLRIEDLTIP